VFDRLHWSFSEKCCSLTEVVFPDLIPDLIDKITNRDFCPEGEWKNVYNIVFIRKFPFNEPARREGAYYGDLTIERRVAGNLAKLFVIQNINLPGRNNPCRIETQFNFEILNDELSTLSPGSLWYWKNTVYDCLQDISINKYSTLEERGRILADGTIQKSINNAEFRSLDIQMPKLPITTNWGLLDAVQRLNWRHKTHRLNFNLLQNMDVLKANQCIEYLAGNKARFGDKEMNLHGYCHCGEGILPSYYWVTDNNILIIARFGLMAYIYKSGVDFKNS
jgi:hypothetical protein